MRFLITAGPTREYLDTVRFLSNGSTGKMGYACAVAAVDRGHKVVLISGPVERERPRAVRFIPVTTSDEMAAAVIREYAQSDAVIMTAAVSDYKPARTLGYKASKSSGQIDLRLVRTVDILAELGYQKERQILVGFAVQDKAPRQNARRKMREKNLDAIVLNSPASIGADRTDIHILTRHGKWQSYPRVNKAAIAVKIVRLAEKLAQQNENTSILRG